MKPYLSMVACDLAPKDRDRTLYPNNIPKHGGKYMKDVVIVNGSRTAIGAYGGTLKSTPVVDLGAAVLKGT